MFKKILVPVDSSPLSRTAAAYAVALAKQGAGSVVFLHVTRPFTAPYGTDYPSYDSVSEKLYSESVAKGAASLMADIKKIADSVGVASLAKVESSDSPEECIARQAASEACDVIIIASHGRGAIGRFFMGSVTTRLIPLSSVPVLVYRDSSMVA